MFPQGQISDILLMGDQRFQRDGGIEDMIATTMDSILMKFTPK